MVRKPPGIGIAGKRDRLDRIIIFKVSGGFNLGPLLTGRRGRATQGLPCAVRVASSAVNDEMLDPGIGKRNIAHRQNDAVAVENRRMGIDQDLHRACIFGYRREGVRAGRGRPGRYGK